MPFSAYNAFESKIPNYTGRLAFRKYLEAGASSNVLFWRSNSNISPNIVGILVDLDLSTGEWCVDKGKSVLEQMSTKGNMARDASHSAGHPNPSGAIGDVFQAPPGRDKNQWGF